MPKNGRRKLDSSEYLFEVRFALAEQGLPVINQPSRESIMMFWRGRYSIEHCVKWFASMVQRHLIHERRTNARAS